jgi:hypothetical protein
LTLISFPLDRSGIVEEQRRESSISSHSEGFILAPLFSICLSLPILVQEKDVDVSQAHVDREKRKAKQASDEKHTQESTKIANLGDGLLLELMKLSRDRKEDEKLFPHFHLIYSTPSVLPRSDADHQKQKNKERKARLAEQIDTKEKMDEQYADVSSVLLPRLSLAVFVLSPYQTMKAFFASTKEEPLPVQLMRKEDAVLSVLLIVSHFPLPQLAARLRKREMKYVQHYVTCEGIAQQLVDVSVFVWLCTFRFIHCSSNVTHFRAPLSRLQNSSSHSKCPSCRFLSFVALPSSLSPSSLLCST